VAERELVAEARRRIRKIPISFTEQSYQMYLTLKRYEEERMVLERRVADPQARDILKTLPHLQLLLDRYVRYGSVEKLMADVGFDFDTGTIGDINKELKAFILGKRNAGIRATAQMLLFQVWLQTGKGTREHLDYTQILTRTMHILLTEHLDPRAKTRDKKMFLYAGRFFDQILHDEYQMRCENGQLSQFQIEIDETAISSVFLILRLKPVKLKELVKRILCGDSYTQITQEWNPNEEVKSTEAISAGISLLEDMLCLPDDTVDVDTVSRMIQTPIVVRVQQLFEVFTQI
jgi:hypothetical protein